MGKYNKPKDSKCAWCGSKFELTRHHHKQNHLPRKLKKKNEFITLCLTCHYEADFDKRMACHHKGSLKVWIERNKKKIKNF